MNEHRKEKQKKKKSIPTTGYILITSIIVAVAFTGCSDHTRERAITQVIEQVYQAPDQDMIDLSAKMSEEMERSTQAGTAYSLEDSEYFKTLKKKFTSYTTEQCYEKLISHRIPSRYHEDLNSLGYEMKIKTVDITKSKKDSNQYDFSVIVKIGPKTGEKEEIEFKGSAQFREGSNKITFIQFIDEELLSKIQKLQISQK